MGMFKEGVNKKLGVIVLIISGTSLYLLCSAILKFVNGDNNSAIILSFITIILCLINAPLINKAANPVEEK